MSLKDYSTTASSNTASPPNGWPEGMTLANVNNTARQMMADIRNLAAEDTIASATTCDLGTKDATFLTVSGTTTITGLGTVSAGIYKFVRFSGALTLTHNATSLILLTAANRTTVAGDIGLYKSEGSGNWREYFYSAQGSYQPLNARLTTLNGLSATAASGIAATSDFIAGLMNDADAAAARGTLELATVGQAEAEDGTATTTRAWTAERVKQAITALGGTITTGTAVATTSGVAADFTGIPAGTKRITVALNGVSHNGSSVLLVQLGTGGAPTTTGYNSFGEGMSGASMTAYQFTTGFAITEAYAAGRTFYGQLIFTHMGSNIWSMSGAGCQIGLANGGSTCGGAVTLSGALDFLRLTSVSADTFDAGSVNILYE